MSDLRELLRVKPGTLRLADVDPRGTPGLPAGHSGKKWSAAEVAGISSELGAYQEKLFASAKAGVTRRREPPEHPWPG